MNCISIVSDNGLSPVRLQAITWNNADLLLIGPLGTNFSEIRIKIENVISEMGPFCPGEEDLFLSVYRWNFTKITVNS